jgi:ABC-type molybdate transport system substrate-binding protein
VPTLQVLAVPEAVNVSAAYEIASVRPVTPTTRTFLDFVVGSAGKKILATCGFSPPKHRSER